MAIQADHRVWIELQYPANDTEGEYRAALGTKLLNRLGVNYHPNLFWWSVEKHQYCVTTDSGGSFLYCLNHGHWFNLEKLAG